MRIRVRRTGGVAGITRSNELDLETLQPDEAAEIRSMLERIERDADETYPGRVPAVGADAFAYEITIEDEDDRQPRVIRSAGRRDTEELGQLVRRILQPPTADDPNETPGGAT